MTHKKTHYLTQYKNKFTQVLSVGFFVIVLCVTGIVVLGTCHAQTITTNSMPLAVPIHFDDTWWTWPAQTGGYTNYTINITPEADGSPDGYFFSSFFIFTNGGATYNPSSGAGYGYLGLQTEAEAGITGKDAIFSIWGATSAIGSQYTTQFNESGAGWSSRISYPWVVGHTYSLKVAYITTDANGEEWVGSVTDTNTNITTDIGQLAVPTSFGMLTNSSDSFHERYEGPVDSCSDMQFSEVEFTNPLFDGSVSPTGHTNYQPDVTPCSNDYGTVDISGGYESAVGGIPPQPTTNTPTPVTTTNTPSTTTPSAPTTSPSTPSVTPITTPSTQKESPSTSSLPVVTNNLSIKITGTDGSVIVGAKVVLDTGQSTTTNSNGMASFRGVTSGSHKVMVTMPGYTTVQTKADILSSQTSKQLTIRLAALRSPISLYIYSGIILVLLVCFGYITKVIIHRKVSRNHPESAVKTVVVSEAPTLVKFPDKALLTAKPPIPLGTLAVNQPWVKPTAQLPLDNQLPEETTPEQPNEPPQLPTSPA